MVRQASGIESAAPTELSIFARVSSFAVPADSAVEIRKAGGVKNISEGHRELLLSHRWVLEMNKQQMNRYRKQLEALAMRVRNDARAIAETALGPSGGQTAGELSDAPTHLGDRGSEEYMTEMNELLLENQQYIVAESRSALERLQQGAFGCCELCGQEISKERLDALPYTRFCLECAAKTNSTPQVNLNNGRAEPRRERRTRDSK